MDDDCPPNTTHIFDNFIRPPDSDRDAAWDYDPQTEWGIYDPSTLDGHKGRYWISEEYGGTHTVTISSRAWRERFRLWRKGYRRR